MISLLELYGLSETNLNKTVNFQQVKRLAPKFAKELEDWYREQDEKWNEAAEKKARQAQFHAGKMSANDEFPETLEPRHTDMNRHFKFRSNPNGSWEAWPTEDHPWNPGVIVLNPKTGQFADTGYTNPEWFDEATGIDNWSRVVKEPK